MRLLLRDNTSSSLLRKDTLCPSHYLRKYRYQRDRAIAIPARPNGTVGEYTGAVAALPAAGFTCRLDGSSGDSALSRHCRVYPFR